MTFSVRGRWVTKRHLWFCKVSQQLLKPSEAVFSSVAKMGQGIISMWMVGKWCFVRKGQPVVLFMEKLYMIAAFVMKMSHFSDINIHQGCHSSHRHKDVG